MINGYASNCFQGGFLGSVLFLDSSVREHAEKSFYRRLELVINTLSCRTEDREFAIKKQLMITE